MIWLKDVLYDRNQCENSTHTLSTPKIRRITRPTRDNKPCRGHSKMKQDPTPVDDISALKKHRKQRRIQTTHLYYALHLITLLLQWVGLLLPLQMISIDLNSISTYVPTRLTKNKLLHRIGSLSKTNVNCFNWSAYTLLLAEATQNSL